MRQVEEARRKREQKLRQVRRRQSAGLFGLLLVVIVLGVGAYLLYNASFWQIKMIEATGGSHFTATQILAMAKIPPGISLLKLNKGEVAQRLMASPWVQEARLYRRLPNRVLISIVERKPFLVLKYKQQNYLLDADGYVIDRAPDNTGLPVLIDLEARRVRIGRTVEAAALREALASTKSLDPEIRQKLAWISVPDADKLAFYTTDNLQIVYGRAAEADKKNFVIKKILGSAKDKIIYINVTIPNSPIVRKLET